MHFCSDELFALMAMVTGAPTVVAWLRMKWKSYQNGL